MHSSLTTTRPKPGDWSASGLEQVKPPAFTRGVADSYSSKAVQNTQEVTQPLPQTWWSDTPQGLKPCSFCLSRVAGTPASLMLLPWERTPKAEAFPELFLCAAPLPKAVHPLVSCLRNSK
jgi:hypothetical protein